MEATGFKLLPDLSGCQHIEAGPLNEGRWLFQLGEKKQAVIIQARSHGLSLSNEAARSPSPKIQRNYRVYD